VIRHQSKSLETGPPDRSIQMADTTGDTNDISSYIQEVMDICGDFGAVYRLSEKLSTSLSANPCNKRGTEAYSIERTANAVAPFRP